VPSWLWQKGDENWDTPLGAKKSFAETANTPVLHLGPAKRSG